MLVKYLNTNQPAVLFLLPVFAAILWIPLVLQGLQEPGHIVAHYVFITKTDTIINGPAGAATAFCTSLLTGVLANRIIINSDLANRPSYIYAFMYVLMEALLRPGSSFYTWQLSQLCLMAALWPMLKIFNQRQVIDLGFIAGFCTGIAFLIYPPAAVFFIIIFVFMQTFRSLSWREWLFPFIGFGIVILFYICYRLLLNQPFYRVYLFERFDFNGWWNRNPFLWVCLGLFILFSLNNFLRGSLRAIMHARKQRIIMIYLFLAVVTLWVVLNITGVTHIFYLFMAVPLCLFGGHYLGHTRFKLAGELLFIGLVALQATRHLV